MFNLYITLVCIASICISCYSRVYSVEDNVKLEFKKSIGKTDAGIHNDFRSYNIIYVGSVVVVAGSLLAYLSHEYVTVCHREHRNNMLRVISLPSDALLPNCM